MDTPEHGERYVTHAQARRIYDLVGRWQDSRLLSERRAQDLLAQHCSPAEARAVFEFGCGTGRFAAALLRSHLADGCTYAAVDVSPTMVGLARDALAPWSDRAAVELTDGSPQLSAADGSYDLFVSSYVLDLLSPDDTNELLAEAHRVLRPGGLLALAGLTEGTTPSARALIWLWRRVWELRPWLVGGCRPVTLAPMLSPDSWALRFRGHVNAYALSSEVLVAERLAIA